jgi:membrane-bound metal-dependent hydrolase YbcI (DUF457 family)
MVAAILGKNEIRAAGRSRFSIAALIESNEIGNRVDTLAHGLWGGAAFYPYGRRRFAAAFAVGMAPDLLSFGLFHLTHPEWLKLRLAGKISGPPPLSILPAYLFHAYNLTHSLVVWAALFALLWLLLRRPPWIWLAWGLHILCDIPTHDTRYLPTPYLWPLPTPFVQGIPWTTPWFMAVNYTALLAVYLGLFFYVRKRRGGRLSMR